jgi:hypothetical protein
MVERTADRRFYAFGSLVIVNVPCAELQPAGIKFSW